MLIAIVLGVARRLAVAAFATNDWIKALGDGFIKLIKMVIAPIIFCTVVSGIAHIQDAKKVGRVGVKALVYFEIVSTFALVIGLIVGNLFQAGRTASAAQARRRGGRQLRQAGRSAEERSISSSTSFPTAWSARSRGATSCRCCCSRSCSASR